MPYSNIRKLLRHGLLPQLAVFEAAARLGSFTRAGESLHIAQPTVSTQIKKLSDTLGLALFEQVGKRIHLTAAGRVLYDGCTEIFDTLSKIDNNLAHLRGLESGRLKLAVSTTGKYFAPRLLASFMARHPGVEVSLQIYNRQGLIERLTRNEDDLYIFANPPTDQEVVCQPILDNPLVVFARADHPLAGQQGLPIESLVDEPFLMREAGSGTRMVAWEVFDRAGFEPSVRMELSTNEAVRQAILAGLGVSILSRYTLGLDTENPNLAVLDIHGFPVQRPWQFVYPVGKQISPSARAFMEMVRVEAKTMVQDHLGHEAGYSAAAR